MRIKYEKELMFCDLHLIRGPYLTSYQCNVEYLS